MKGYNELSSGPSDPCPLNLRSGSRNWINIDIRNRVGIQASIDTYNKRIESHRIEHLEPTNALPWVC
jgi:hypothetical protein